MSFDRKTNSNAKIAQARAGLAEFLPIPDADEGQGYDSAPQNAAAERNSGGQIYSSGAFPALEVAYSGRRRAAGFTDANQHDNIQYRSGENQSRLSEQGQIIRRPYPQPGNLPQRGTDSGGMGIFPGGDMRQRNAGTADSAARSEQIMADRHYSGRDEQNGYRSGDAAGRAGVRRPSAPRAPENYAPAQPDPRAGGRQNFSEDMLRSGLGGDAPLQPASFSPSDYDYDYNPADETRSPRRAEMEPAAPARAPAEFSPQYSASLQQQSAYAPQADYAALYDEYGYQPAPQQEGYGIDSAAPSVPELRRESRYSPQAGADNYYRQNDYDYADAQPQAYAPQDDGGYAPAADSYQPAPVGHAPSFAEARADDYQQAYDDYGAAQADYGRAAPQIQPQAQDLYYDEGGYAPQAGGGAQPAGQGNDLPFGAYPEGDSYLADDYGRLEDDAVHMGQLADSFSPVAAGSPAGGANSGGQGIALPVQTGRQPGQSRAVARPRAAAEPESFFPAPGDAQTAGSADNFAVDDGYNDELYDWTPPAVDAAAAPRAQRAAAPKQQKSRKMLYVAAAVIVAVAVVFGLYLSYSSVAGGSDEPVIIHKTGGDYKVKADDKAAADSSQEQSVSEGVNGAAADNQKALIDKTETPIDAQKMEERLPFNEQKPFNQSAADNLVKTAVAQAAPVHIVPSVKVDADRKITASSAGGEKVLMPAAPSAAAPVAVAQAEPAAIKPAEPAKQAQIAAVAPASAVPLSEPDGTPARKAPVPAVSAPKAEAPAQKTAAAASSGTSGFSMQISSQPSKEAAEASLREAKKHLNADLAGRLVVVSATISGKGTYYRVRIPAGSREEASAMCEEYKQAGGHCFVAH